MNKAINPTLKYYLIQYNTSIIPYHNKIELKECSTIEINYSSYKNGLSYSSESARSKLLLIIQYIHILSNDCSISS